MLGITPLTINGFILAGIIIVLNNVLGYGWASDLLGQLSNSPMESSVVAPSNRQVFDLDDEKSIKEYLTK